jgi:photosystem II stability/assembly factor-like uncharacterized protein
MVSRRRYEPLGIVLATDEGLLQMPPGEKPERVVEGRRFTSADYHDGLAIAGAPEAGAWVHDGRRWRQQWEGELRSVSVTPSGHLYIGTTDGTLLESTDRGETWAEIEGVQNVIKHGKFAPPTGESRPFVASTVEVREGIVVGIAGGGAWHTRDGGKSWLRRSDGLDLKVHGLWVHPEQRDRLFATADRGVFRSEDEGFSWVQSLGGLDRSWGGTVAVLPGAPDALVLTAARHAPGLEGAVFRSPNGGVTWSRVMLEEEDEWDRVPVVVRPWDWEDVLFLAAGDKLWASHDRGRNWLALTSGLPVANAIAAGV